MRFVYIYFLSILIVLGCSNDIFNLQNTGETTDSNDKPEIPEVSPAETCDVGDVFGRLCIFDSDVPFNTNVILYAATCVEEGEEQVQFEMRTDENGQIVFSNVPVGDWIVRVSVSNNTYDISVNAGINSLSISDYECVSQRPKVAIVTGDFDSPEILLDTLKIDYELYDHTTDDATNFLNDFDLMSQYEYIFINCTNTYNSAPPDYFHKHIYSDTYDYTGITYENLRRFVDEGGNLYLSDLAWPMLEAMDINAVDFYGDESSNYQVVNNGTAGTLEGVISSTVLEQFMAQSELEVLFNTRFSVVDSVSANVSTYITTDVTTRDNSNILEDRPILISYKPSSSSGYVVFVSFHFNVQIVSDMSSVLSYLIFHL